mmetsp:Transcript_1298/g.2003  ORF Transcript_1298/g.2003 Transcript_1298/m.2003 type:complete len:227 (+) Transcript_1298:1710-2390(+)
MQHGLIDHVAKMVEQHQERRMVLLSHDDRQYVLSEQIIAFSRDIGQDLQFLASVADHAFFVVLQHFMLDPFHRSWYQIQIERVVQDSQFQRFPVVLRSIVDIHRSQLVQEELDRVIRVLVVCVDVLCLVVARSNIVHFLRRNRHMIADQSLFAAFVDQQPMELRSRLRRLCWIMRWHQIGSAQLIILQELGHRLVFQSFDCRQFVRPLDQIAAFQRRLSGNHSVFL